MQVTFQSIAVGTKHVIVYFPTDEKDFTKLEQMSKQVEESYGPRFKENMGINIIALPSQWYIEQIAAQEGLVINLPVGNMPSNKVQEYTKEITATLHAKLNREIVVIPVRS